jgi:hypothetical protein
MTADEWHASTSLEHLLAACGLAEGDRRLRLFSAACARRVAAVMPDDAARGLVDLAEQRADGLLPDREWLRAVVETVDPYLGNEAARDGAGGSTFGVLMHLHRTDPRSILRLAEAVVEARAHKAYTGGYPTAVGLDEWMRLSVESEATDLCRLFRCVCGNPFRRVALDPAWLTSTVRTLAAGIDAGRAFDRMPILADALQDAGADNEDVLDHCRGPGPHAHGCWVVDLLLGNE